MVQNRATRIQSDGMVNRREQFAGMDRILSGGRCRFVRLTVGIAALHATTGNDARVTIRPMVATVVGVTVAGSAHTALRAASEFAHSYDQRFLQKSAFIEVFQQCRKSRIEHWSGLRLHASGKPRMHVP